ncbi:MAG: T9SS type A sorting domain-containing protein [Bacteroidales bacterium]|nr:T9SS type A sorting domain-containing protein [Bacteroidales bacterium]
MNITKRFIQTSLTSLLGVMLMFSASLSQAEDYNFSNPLGEKGFNVTKAANDGVTITYSVHGFTLGDVDIKGEAMRTVELYGHFLQGDEGAPNLPGNGRLIAVPEGASVNLNIVSYRTETYSGIDIAPAPRIPWDTDDQPLEYVKNESIYQKDAFYPEKPVKISEITQVRGVDVVMLGITPFQYNPVTGELVVYRDIVIDLDFEGGSGYFGEDRLRSRWWDPLLADMLLNFESLPVMDYNKNLQGKAKETGCEYLIISPTGPEFLQWADSIKMFRTLQGISTDIVTIEEVGGNNTNSIETYVNNAYNNWDIVPAAILLLGDYGTNPVMHITSPVWNNYCVSDNIYADVDNNNLPDIVFARMTAQNATHLQTMVTKFLNYERTPPTSPDFYAHPITALGWQTERWFQLCSETIGGFWKNVQGKSPVRINAIYQGTPGTVWSTATNTATVVNYFGPNGQEYIPATPAELGGWTGGTGAMVNAAINNGSFMLQHRDHGYESGWGEPAYSSGNINGLTNTDLTYIMSINCLTGKYNLGGECFAEKFHRHTSGGQNAGALGILAASEVSYSFVNDAYVWGAYDNMWTNFMPDYGANPASRGVLPAFGNSAGKYFLYQSSWPYNTNNKLVTYHLFHHHGDAFLTVYSQIPQNLTVVHEATLMTGAEEFEVTADDGSFIALTVAGEIIGTAEGTGAPVMISIPAQASGSEMIVTITKQNYYRYGATVDVIASTTANAGPDVEVCESNTHNCQGDATNYVSLEWSTAGTGTFDDNTILTPVYTPGAEDITAGSVVLTLTVHSTEITVSDDMTLTISPMPSAVAGEDAGICETETYTLADAAAADYSALLWSTGGDGTFDDGTLVNPVYTPGSQDIETGTVTLTLSATALGSCDDVVDEMVITIYKSAEAFAGADASLCSSGSYTISDATAANYASLNWTTAGDGTFDDNTLINPEYTPGTNDIAGGSVVLTLTAEGNSTCTDAIGEVTLTLVAAPEVFAGDDDEICDDEVFSVTTATVANAASYLWSTGGDGTFDDNTSMTPVYTPGTQDIAAGNVTLTLTATGNAPCGEMSDQILLDINECFGIDENEGLISFDVFPNPSDGNISISLKTTDRNVITVSVFNTVGDVLYEKANVRTQGEYNCVLNLNADPGIYYLRITGDNLLVSKKIIVR